MQEALQTLQQERGCDWKEEEEGGRGKGGRSLNSRGKMKERRQGGGEGAAAPRWGSTLPLGSASSDSQAPRLRLSTL
jgi:hypothetical protein